MEELAREGSVAAAVGIRDMCHVSGDKCKVTPDKVLFIKKIKKIIIIIIGGGGWLSWCFCIFSY